MHESLYHISDIKVFLFRDPTFGVGAPCLGNPGFATVQRRCNRNLNFDVSKSSNSFLQYNHGQMPKVNCKIEPVF